MIFSNNICPVSLIFIFLAFNKQLILTIIITSNGKIKWICRNKDNVVTIRIIKKINFLGIYFPDIQVFINKKYFFLF
jgi:hypothetical protein